MICRLTAAVSENYQRKYLTNKKSLTFNKRVQHSITVHPKALKLSIFCAIWAHKGTFARSQHNFLFIIKKGTRFGMQDDSSERDEINEWGTMLNNQWFTSRHSSYLVKCKSLRFFEVKKIMKLSLHKSVSPCRNIVVVVVAVCIFRYFHLYLQKSIKRKKREEAEPQGPNWQVWKIQNTFKQFALLFSTIKNNLMADCLCQNTKILLICF